MLFFHVAQTRDVVVRLQADRFTPQHLDQLTSSVAAVEGGSRRPQHDATVGLLVCAVPKDRTDGVVRYVLDSTSCTYDELPADGADALASIAAVINAYLTARAGAILEDR